jgi:enoyl-CoA hydratase
VSNALVLYEVKEEIAYITLNRPEKGNALSPELCAELGRTWERFEDDAAGRVAILNGAGKNFCVGLDLESGAEGEKALHLAFPANGVRIFKPIIAAVQGWATGSGYKLASEGADITIATESAHFSYPEPRVGIAGNLSFAVPYVLFKRALEFHLTGEPVDAHKAYEMGLVNKVVPEAELMKEARRMAEILKANAPLTLRALKYGFYKTANPQASHAAMEFKAWIKPQHESEDMKEGARAFLEKRRPRFQGK